MKSKYYKAKIFDIPSGGSLRFQIHEFFYCIRRFFQRGRNGYAISDVWDLSSWFLKTISHMLKDFAVGSCAYPCDVESHEEWIGIINQMQKYFEDAINEESPTRNESLKNGFDLFIKWFNELWD